MKRNLPVPRCAFLVTAVLMLGLVPFAGEARLKKLKPQQREALLSQTPDLWRDPSDIRSRNLFYGSGGEQDQPRAPFTFLEEDMSGTSPKYVVRDRNGVKWTVKLGLEARPETASSRLVWAVGYFANEDYFLESMQIRDLPSHLKRGAGSIRPGGLVHAVRLKRHREDEKKIANWRWRDNPWSGTRELNGLRVMMALVNNWDLKDQNTAIYSEKGVSRPIYLVSDLGASFGAGEITFPKRKSKDDLDAYSRSTFLRKVSPEFVDLGTPGPPAKIYILLWPPRFIHRTSLESLSRRVPRADARWIGGILSRLSPQQIRDAFRASGYSDAEVDGFTRVIQARVVELNAL